MRCRAASSAKQQAPAEQLMSDSHSPCSHGPGEKPRHEHGREWRLPDRRERSPDELGSPSRTCPVELEFVPLYTILKGRDYYGGLVGRTGDATNFPVACWPVGRCLLCWLDFSHPSTIFKGRDYYRGCVAETAAETCQRESADCFPGKAASSCRVADVGFPFHL